MDVTGIVFTVALIGFLLATMLRAFLEVAGWDKTKFAEFLQRITFQPSRVSALTPYQVALVSVWYVGCLTVAVYLPYALLATPDLPFLAPASSQQLLGTVNGSDTAKFLVQCFACGVVGATMYGLVWISRIHENTTEWYFRRYLLLPVLGGFLGGCSYFFVKAGLITVQQPSAAANAPGATGVSSFAAWGIAFLSGFASRELTAKLIQIAEAVFAKAPETSPLGPTEQNTTQNAAPSNTPLQPAEPVNK